ncbi:DNA polymerase III subunit gamma/tau [Candidatus Uhrbacteria bacterium]|nr:DNA polymerase III subunit gamma/tau [Candidatus Uhrbacteria bacterium]
MALALYRKYRPQSFAEITGQEHVKTTLERQVASGKVAHAYLFCGLRGTGKTSLARILAKAVNCNSRKKNSGEPCLECESCAMIRDLRALDVLEIDAATHTQVDNVRQVIVETAKFAPMRLRYKFFIIDEAHMLSTGSWNALLKIMEEPPAHVIFVLATTEAHKVPATIISRCQRFDFRRVPSAAMVERLSRIAKSEKIKIEEGVLQTVARLSEGCVRDAESILEQLFALGEEKITGDTAALVLPKTSLPCALELLEVLSKRDHKKALESVDGLLDQGIDLDRFSVDLLELFRKVLLIKMAGADTVAALLDLETLKKLEGLANIFSAAQILFAIDALVKAKQALKTAAIPQLPLEVAVVEVCGLEAHPGATDAQPQRSSPPLPSEDKAVRKNTAAFSLAEIRAKWPEVLQRAQQENHSLPFLLSTSEPLGVEGGVLQVGVQYPFYKDKLDDQKCRAVLEKIVSELYTAPLRVQGVILETPQARPEPIDEVVKVLGGRVVE